MDGGYRNTRWTLRERVERISEDVLSERVQSAKRSRAGYLGAVTRIRGQIEALLDAPANAESVKSLSQQYHNSWNKFVESHKYYMSMMDSNSQEFYYTLQQFDHLHVDKVAFVQKISGYLLDAAAYFNEIIMDNLHLKREHVSSYAESVDSYKSSIPRGSKYSSSSVVLEKRAQAVKANIALRLAEQEQCRRLEGERKLLEIEKKHREILRQQRLENEELEMSKRWETLKQQTDRELAEVRQKAALMELEAQLEAQMEEQGEIDMNLVTQDQNPILTDDDQFTGEIPRPLLYQDFSFEDEPFPVLSNSPGFAAAAQPLHSTSVVTASSPWGPWIGSSGPGRPRSVGNTFERSAQRNTASVCQPRSSSGELPLPSVNQQNVLSPGPEYFCPCDKPSGHEDEPSTPTINHTTFGVPPVRWTSASDDADQSLRTNHIEPALCAGEPRTPLPAKNATFSPSKPPPTTTSISPNEGILTMLASTMQEISSVQQKLTANQSLPAIELEKFSGSPEHFPLFKQRFEKRIMSRQDLDDGEKMLRLLQFLGGEAKEAVASLEAVDGGIHEALKILQRRYGRTCLVVSSIVNGLVKGAGIPNGDKTALRKFADKTARALATLKSLDCLHEINQGNLVEMVS